MCGISAILTSKNIIQSYIFSSLSMLLNRGYDSAGISYIKNNNIKVIKKASTNKQSGIDYLINSDINLTNTNVAISHCRWATHGAKTDINAHPHLCYRSKFSIVHNGIIENYSELKNFLTSKNIPIISGTDTEIIVNLISYFHIQMNDIIKSIEMTLKLLKGTWGLAIICNDTPKHIYLSRHGSPLLISKKDNNTLLIVSESSAFINNVKNYMSIDENVLVNCYLNEDNEIILSNEFANYEINEDIFDYTPAPFTHWTLKEIFEQKDSLNRAIHYGGRINDDTVILGGLNNYKDILRTSENLVIIGCGTSYNAGLIGEIFLRKLNIFNSINVVEGSEFDYSYVKEKTAYILISQSGETRDLIKLIPYLKKYTEMPIIGITNVIDSDIAKNTDCGIYLNAGREFGVASTKSFTSQIIILFLLSIWFLNLKDKIFLNQEKIWLDDLIKFISKTDLIINMLNDKIKLIADQIIETKKNSLFILGKNYNKVIAYESALKIKELSYYHAEGYALGALKHGPFALIEDNTPIIFLVSPEDDINRINSNLEEVKARGALSIIIGFHPDADISINIDNKFHFIWNAVAMQLLGYYLCVNTNKNPDFPRNLAKVVTVD
jgi:glucosamine--fructose-6-phosphate aminotransferase (isomerizing)